MPIPPASTTAVETKFKHRLRSRSFYTIQKFTSRFTPSNSKNNEPDVDGRNKHKNGNESQSSKQMPQYSQSWPIAPNGETGGQNRIVLGNDIAMEQSILSDSTRRISRSFDLGRTATENNVEPSATSVGLLPSLFISAPSGSGLKSHRLTKSSPKEYPIECVPLKSEFKSVGALPGTGGKLLGKGATANVRLMVRKGGASNELFAVKDFRGKEIDEEEEEYTRKVKSEYTIAKSLTHPNIVTTMQLCTHRGRWNHVMEYCAEGELFALIAKKRFSQDDRSCLWKQLLRGVNHLHGNGIAHRDIKPENLLITSAGRLKITDFGVAVVFSGDHPASHTTGGLCGKNMGETRKCAPGICGSLPYIAPEVLQKDVYYDPRPLDVWSCAIIFFTMRFYGSPWHSASPENENYARFKRGWDEWLPGHQDGRIPDPSSVNAENLPRCGPLFQALQKPALKRLLLKMLHPHPEKRISIENVLKTSLVQHIDCCSEEEVDQSKTVDASKSNKGVCVLKKKHCHIPPKERRIHRLL